MVKAIRIRNFKAIRDSGWIHLKKVNYIMGKNSAGKSSLLKAIQLIEGMLGTKAADNLYPKEISLKPKQDRDLGTFKDTVNDNKKPFKSFSISYKIDLSKKVTTGRKWLEHSWVIEFSFKGASSSSFCKLNKIIISRYKDKLQLCKIIFILASAEFSLDIINLEKIGLDIESLSAFLINEDIINKTEKNIFKHLIETIPNGLNFRNLKKEQRSFKIDKRNYIGSDWLQNLFTSSIMKIHRNQLKLYTKKENTLYESINNQEQYLNELAEKLDKKVYAKLIETPENEIVDKEEKTARLKKWFGSFITHVSKEGELNVQPLGLVLMQKQLAHYQKCGFKPIMDKNEMILFHQNYQFGKDVSFEFGNILLGIINEIKIFHKNLKWIKPLRGTAQRSIDRTSENNSSWNELFENKKETAVKVEYAVKKLKDENFTNLKLRLQRGNDKRFTINITDSSGNDRNLADLGFGYSQSLPIIFDCLEDIDEKHIPSQQTILIEQPEIHLHPESQARFANFFLAIAQDFNKQLFIETHSEHLILKTQLRIKENPSLVELCQLIFVEKVASAKSGRHSTVQVVEFKKNGELTRPFPDDFFDRSYIMKLDLVS